MINLGVTYTFDSVDYQICEVQSYVLRCTDPNNAIDSVLCSNLIHDGATDLLTVRETNFPVTTVEEEAQYVGTYKIEIIPMYQTVQYDSAITTFDVVVQTSSVEIVEEEIVEEETNDEESCSVTALEVYYQSFENATIILGDSLVLPFANYKKTPDCEE